MLDLQGIVDGLAQRLGRAVAIDNIHVEMIVTSAQIGTIDDSRRAAVLQRQTPSNVVTHVKALNLGQREGPISVPGPPELRTLERICYPIRVGSSPLGYLWLINEPPVSPRDLTVVEEALPEIADRLFRSERDLDAVIGKAGWLADSALASKTPEALVEAYDLGLLPERRHLALYRCAVVTTDEQCAPASMIRRLIEDLVSTTYPGNFICTVNDDQLTVFTGSRDAPDQPLSFVSAVRLSAVRTQLRLDGIGVARFETSRWDAVSEANTRAKDALLLATGSGSDRVIRWEDIGLWKFLLPYVSETNLVAEISREAEHLICSEPALAETLWVYFDSGRDAQLSCATLHVHRATLYYRLKRIREVVGDQVLTDGKTALNAHVALQYWWQVAAGKGKPGIHIPGDPHAPSAPALPRHGFSSH